MGLIDVRVHCTLFLSALYSEKSACENCLSDRSVLNMAYWIGFDLPQASSAAETCREACDIQYS